jgi:hypothetical protein
LGVGVGGLAVRARGLVVGGLGVGGFEVGGWGVGVRGEGFGDEDKTINGTRNPKP